MTANRVPVQYQPDTAVATAQEMAARRVYERHVGQCYELEGGRSCITCWLMEEDMGIAAAYARLHGRQEAHS